jgi:hypothetical protein
MNTDNYRRKLTPIVIVLLLAVAVVSSGCLWAPDLAMVRKDIERQIPGANFEKEIELSLGPITMSFARLLTRLVPDAREATGYLQDVRRIELAVYNADHVPPTSTVTMPEKLRKMTAGDDWELAVKIRDDDELMWVMYRIDDETIKELYVVMLDKDELLMVKAEGNLERLVARALSDSGAMKGLPDTEDSI